MDAGFGECLKWVDVVTVSTKTLKSALGTNLPHLNKEILVTPNAIDFDVFQPSVLDRDDGRIVLGWAGSNTHDGDMKEIAMVLPDLIRKYPNLYIEFVGGFVPVNMRGMERVSYRPWVPVGEFANRFPCWSWNLSIAPLESNRFNASKSAIKQLEAAAVRIPCLASNVRPYHEFCSLGGKELEWLLCETNRDWRTKLERLIEEPELRDRLAGLMYDTAKRHFSADVIANNWKFAMRRAAGWN